MNEYLILFDLIGVLAHRRFRIAERCFSALGLNHSEARLLTLLRQQGGAAAQDELSQLLFVDRSNAGRALKHLEQQGYIARRRDDADRRAYFVRMTDKGRDAVAEISKLRKEMARQLLGDLEKDEAAAIAALLKKAVTDEEFALRSRAPGTNRRGK